MAPPHTFTTDLLTSALVLHWKLRIDSARYLPVGFGSHHWEVTDDTGGRWFVTIDELADKQHRRDEPLDAAFQRLRAALASAQSLAREGHAFVVAPMSTQRGEPLARLSDRFAGALYRFVDGQSFAWGEFSGPTHRQAILNLIVSVHTASVAVRRHAGVDDFTIPHRDELTAALDEDGGVEHGPYTRRAAKLLTSYAAPLRRLLARYDRLAALGRAESARMVLTHGEPHSGNTIRTSAGWLLIDWDTALIAPPERDLSVLDPGDGSVLTGYAETTGVTPRPAMLELYRLRWQLADIATGASRFRRWHAGNPDDDKTWEVLRSVTVHVTGLPST